MIPTRTLRVLFLAGQSGSGTSTYKDLLSQSLRNEGLQVVAFDKDDMVNEGSAVGRHSRSKHTSVKPFYEKLESVLRNQPDAFVICAGYLRELKEAYDLADLLCSIGVCGAVIHLDESDKVCLERIKQRKNPPDKPEDEILSYYARGKGAQVMSCLDRRRLAEGWPFVYRRIGSGPTGVVLQRILGGVKSLSQLHHVTSSL